LPKWHKVVKKMLTVLVAVVLGLILAFLSYRRWKDAYRGLIPVAIVICAFWAGIGIACSVGNGLPQGWVTVERNELRPITGDGHGFFVDNATLRAITGKCDVVMIEDQSTDSWYIVHQKQKCLRKSPWGFALDHDISRYLIHIPRGTLTQK
jgi:hypothetical protein